MVLDERLYSKPFILINQQIHGREILPLRGINLYVNKLVKNKIKYDLKWDSNCKTIWYRVLFNITGRSKCLSIKQQIF